MQKATTISKETPVVPVREKGSVGQTIGMDSYVLQDITRVLGPSMVVSAAASTEVVPTPQPVVPVAQEPMAVVEAEPQRLSPLAESIDLDQLAREIAHRMQETQKQTHGAQSLPEGTPDEVRRLVEALEKRVEDKDRLVDELVSKQRKEERDKLTRLVRPWVEKVYTNLKEQGGNPDDKVKNFAAYLATLTEQPNELNSSVKDFIEAAASNAVQESAARAQDARKIEEHFQKVNSLSRELLEKEARIKQLEGELQKKKETVYGSQKPTQVIQAAASTPQLLSPPAQGDFYQQMLYNSSLASLAASGRKGGRVDEAALQKAQQAAKEDAEMLRKVMKGGPATTNAQLYGEGLMQKSKSQRLQ